MKVKVGDRLRAKVDQPEAARIYKGEIASVISLEQDGYITFKIEDPSIASLVNEWAAAKSLLDENFELIENTPVQTTGAAKNDKNKLDLSLIPKVALEAEAKAFMVGEAKYGRYNYTKGHKASQLIAALMRHATAWNEGEENDSVDGQPHLGSIRACAAMILRQMELGTFIDDRFKK